MAKYDRLVISGNADYVARTTDCFRLIDSIPDGRKILEAICARQHQVKIQGTNQGNSCRALSKSCYPPLTVAIAEQDQGTFKDELNAAITKAKSVGLTLEHLGRQLAMGLSPATYTGADNVGPPSLKKPPPASATPQSAMFGVGLQIADSLGMLKELMDGARTVKNLPAGWDYELPRLLRQFLNAGAGGPCTVSFNPTKTFYCEDDAAMHQRPPAIGLAHELIHALHNVRGMNLALVRRNDQNIEELITTGMAPYNFEELSDNKLRTQWPRNLELREDYAIKGPVTSVSV